MLGAGFKVLSEFLHLLTALLSCHSLQFRKRIGDSEVDPDNDNRSPNKKQRLSNSNGKSNTICVIWCKKSNSISSLDVDNGAVANPPDSPTTGVTSFGDLDRVGNEEEGGKEKLERETTSFGMKDGPMDGISSASHFEDVLCLSEMSDSETEEEYDNDLRDYLSDMDKEDPKDEDRRASAEKFKNSKLNDGEPL